jgi:hypothetical protein
MLGGQACDRAWDGVLAISEHLRPYLTRLLRTNDGSATRPDPLHLVRSTMSLAHEVRSDALDRP